MILERIIETKKIEVARSKEEMTLGDLEDQIGMSEVDSLSEAIRRPGVNIIAEIKYRSPSHGLFHCQDSPEELAAGYVKNGAAAISILTDETFFGGRLEYVRRVSEYLTISESEPEGEGLDAIESVPLLRKDFIIDRYQVAEARREGASAYLLIVACLERPALRELQCVGREYGMEALVEVHDIYELEAALDTGSTMVGVNNRDLRSFEVNVKTSFEIARELEGETGLDLVAESGITDSSLIAELRDAGFSAFLIGTAFMDSPDPAGRLHNLLTGVAE
jgi:indole-3-glycerol phosphate synthase